MKLKRTYTTEFIRCYKAGLLSIDECKSIPRSTRYAWRKRDLQLYRLPELYIDKETTSLTELKYEKLLQITKSLFAIIYCYRAMLNDHKIKAIIIQKSKSFIIKTIDLANENLGLKRTLRLMNITYQQYFAWKNHYDCKASLLKLCRKKFTQQLSYSEVTIIESYIKNEELRHWSISSIYCKMMREQKAAMSIATFRKYANYFKNTIKLKYKDKIWSSLKASVPYNIVQMDVTIFRSVDRSKIYLYLIIDNFSRTILGYKASLTYSATISLELLKQVCKEHNIADKKDIIFVTDDGIEYKSVLANFTASSSNLQHNIAQKDIVQSNSMIEAVNKRIKYDFLFTSPLPDFESVTEYLKIAIPAYNNKPLLILSGYTPTEVLNGSIPNIKRFATNISNAKKERQNSNAKQSCCIP